MRAVCTANITALEPLLDCKLLFSGIIKEVSDIVKYYQALPGIIRHYQGLSGITWHYQESSDIIKYYQPLSGITSKTTAEFVIKNWN